MPLLPFACIYIIDILYVVTDRVDVFCVVLYFSFCFFCLDLWRCHGRTTRVLSFEFILNFIFGFLEVYFNVWGGKKSVAFTRVVKSFLWHFSIMTEKVAMGVDATTEAMVGETQSRQRHQAQGRLRRMATLAMSKGPCLKGAHCHIFSPANFSFTELKISVAKAQQGEFGTYLR